MSLRSAGVVRIHVWCWSIIATGIGVCAAGEPTVEECRAAMTRAAGFFREQVAVRGGYVYFTSLDPQGRWVERYQGERLVGQPKFASGQPYLSSETFSRNLETLAEYVRGAAKSGG